jgi:antitoxin VapB
MTTTRLFKNGNSQAVRIPAELAYERNEMELEIERIGQEIRIRPAQRTLGGVMDKFAAFSPGLFPDERGEQEQTEREAL